MRRIVALAFLLAAFPAWALVSIVNDAPQHAGGGGGASPTWNPADNVNYTLSNSNRTAAITAAGGHFGVRSVQTHSSGQYYAEITLDVGFASSSFEEVGVCTSATNMAASVCSRDDNNGITLAPSSGILAINGGPAGACQGSSFSPNFSPVAGDTLAIDIDITNKRFWAAIIHSGTRGPWNGTNCNGDPAAGTGYSDITAMNFTGCCYLISTGFSGTEQDTIPTSYLGTTPSGSTNW